MMLNEETGTIIARHKFFLFFLFVLALLVRSLVFIGYLSKNKNYWQVDSNTYHLVAEQIKEGKGISSADGSPHFYRLPGYPLFLSLYYKVCGVDTKNVLWFQIVLASCIPMLVFLLALTLFPGAVLVAKAAALWTAIHLGFVLYAGFFMTESLFIFFLLLFFIFFFSAFHLFFCRAKHEKNSPAVEISNWCVPAFLPESAKTGPSFLRFCERFEKTDDKLASAYLSEGDRAVKAFFLAGLFLGAASLVRPVGQYLIVLACVLVLFSRDAWRKKIMKSCTLAIAWLVPVSFWLVRNLLLTGHLFFHTLPGGHFLYLSAARVAMHTHNCSYQEARQLLRDEVQAKLASKEQSLGRPLLEIESCQVHERLAIQYFKEYPWIALKNWCTDMFRAMFSLYSAELLYLTSGRQEIDYFKKDRPWWHMFERYLFPQTDSWFLKSIVWGEIAMFLIILIGFVGWLIKTIRDALRGAFEQLCLVGKVLPFMLLFIVLALSGGYARMRLPIEPLLMIFAVSWWLYWIMALRMKKNKEGLHVRN